MLVRAKHSALPPFDRLLKKTQEIAGGFLCVSPLLGSSLLPILTLPPLVVVYR